MEISIIYLTETDAVSGTTAARAHKVLYKRAGIPRPFPPLETPTIAVSKGDGIGSDEAMTYESMIDAAMLVFFIGRDDVSTCS
jgi:hypothetical protein